MAGGGDDQREVEMLLPSEDKQPQLPLDTPEQIQHSLEVDHALARRADRELRQTASQRAKFRLFAEKVAFFLGLIVFIAAAILWIEGHGAVIVSGLATSGLAALGGLAVSMNRMVDPKR
jgi:hypothetical protein